MVEVPIEQHPAIGAALAQLGLAPARPQMRGPGCAEAGGDSTRSCGGWHSR